MRALLAALLLPCAVLAQTNPYQPSGSSSTDTPTFSWPATAGATSYTLDLSQIGSDALVSVTPAQAGCSSGVGACSYSPGIAFAHGRIAAWWSLAYNVNTLISQSGENMFYVATGLEAPMTFDATACTRWAQVSDFPGQGRRVIDFNTSTGYGTQVFHKDLWTVVDVSDIVPATARAARLLIETVYSASCTNNQYCSLMAISTRRHGSAYDASPYVHYTTSARNFTEITVLLNGGKFDFFWSDTANGINVAQAENSTLTGELITGVLVGYCE